MSTWLPFKFVIKHMTEVDVGAFLVPVFLLFLVNSLLCWIALPHSQILRAVSLIFFAKSLLLWPVCAGANDAMSDKVLCKYFASGCCKYGEDCRFSHDFAAPQSMVCKFFLQGNCVYGDTCRYDHVKPDWGKKETTSTHRPTSGMASTSPAYTFPQSQSLPPYFNKNDGNQSEQSGPPEELGQKRSTALKGWRIGLENAHSGHEEDLLGVPEEDEVQSTSDNFVIDDNPNEEFDLWRKPDKNEGLDIDEDAEELLCWEYCTTGHCTTGEACQYTHGDYCETCQKYCLDRINPESRAQHLQDCRKLHIRLQAYIKSMEAECAICLEKVLTKSNLSDRRFGLMACDHIFCLSCIRNWRSADDGNVDVTSALRTCPVCRVATHFITPSTVFPADENEKDAIIEGYKAKMAEIDCKHFNFGEGRCPFVNSCFYKHALRDGTQADVAVRKAANSNGEHKFIRDQIQLGEFMDGISIRSTTRRRR